MAMRSRSTFLTLCSPATCRAVARRLASERGFAVPTVTLMMLAALRMAGVAVSTSMQRRAARCGTRARSRRWRSPSRGRSGSAHYNRYGIAPATASRAPTWSTPSDAEGWCTKVTGTTVNGGLSATRRSRPAPTARGQIAWTGLDIVAVGTMGGVTCRVAVHASSSSGQDMFVDADVLSEDGIRLDSNSEIHSGSATNGDITMASNAKHCGPASVGIGKELSGGGYYSDINCTTIRHHDRRRNELPRSTKAMPRPTTTTVVCSEKT